MAGDQQGPSVGVQGKKSDNFNRFQNLIKFACLGLYYFQKLFFSICALFQNVLSMLCHSYYSVSVVMCRCTDEDFVGEGRLTVDDDCPLSGILLYAHYSHNSARTFFFLPEPPRRGGGGSPRRGGGLSSTRGRGPGTPLLRSSNLVVFLFVFLKCF